MAGSITWTVTKYQRDGKKIVEVDGDWTSTAGGAVSGISTDDKTFRAGTLTQYIKGMSLNELITKPGTTTPTAYTIAINMDSEDLFGTLAARSTTATESAFPVAGGAYGTRRITGPLTPVIASAGSSKTGSFKLIFEE